MTTRPRRIRLDLTYDGTAFAGWQQQRRGRTVQGTLQEVLERLQGGVAARVRGAGRTDAGVHARGQVAHSDVTTRLDDATLHHALCGMLPGDVRPRSVRTVDPAFDAARDAIARSYRYRLDRSRHGDPLLRSQALHHYGPLDRRRLDAALARLPGQRDWSGFAGSACRSRNRVRTLYEAHYVEADETGWFSFRASGYLNYMVRNLVGTLLSIGRGRYSLARLDRALETGDRRLAGPTAPAHGLCLWHVEYPEGREP